ncbi:uncharacterized protein LOC122092230 [Macadamia integrifolia]|uniref:uncharacterized protein LOC122082167 n=1 Tax=Macadamia integrifolia TaxID=60698 RepID=UPI001C4FEF84|nr:uncharacterized protein LOC122082167 [Macadamia integrifolia]XP_042518501.1 uncharacterized protein LOC122092230 [Macadamia integrifolia]
MHPLGKGYVIFQFQCEGDKAAVWRRSPLRIGDQVIRFQHWKPDFNIHEKQLFTKLVWIRFPDLPLEYWHENVLLFIAKAVGCPVPLDRRTRQGILGFFARVLVEIDISDLAERVEEVQVERLELGTSQVYGFCQKVVYEDNMERCGYCKRVGHLISKCRLKRLDDEKQCAAEKLAKVPGAVYVEDGVNSGGSNSVRESPSRGRSLPHQQNNFDPIQDLISPNSNSSNAGGDIQILLDPSNFVSNVLGKESNGDENSGIKEGFVSGTVIELESDSKPLNKEGEISNTLPKEGEIFGMEEGSDADSDPNPTENPIHGVPGDPPVDPLGGNEPRMRITPEGKVAVPEGRYPSRYRRLGGGQGPGRGVAMASAVQPVVEDPGEDHVVSSLPRVECSRGTVSIVHS